MPTPPHLQAPEVLERLRRRAGPGAAWAMYSSLLDGIVTDPALMALPVQDHLAHRGDGVFETLKAIGGCLYNPDAHWQRLEGSAAAMRLALPWSPATLTERAVDVLRAADRDTALIRVLVSRGPGSFGVHPRDCPQPSLYIVVYPCLAPFMERHPDGASAITCRTPLKPALFATAKTCNYLPNALMADEAHRAGADFALGLDDRGCLAEGPTENAVVVLEENELIVPVSPQRLPGTTLNRVCALARAHPGEPGLSIREADLPADQLPRAREILLTGTSIDVTAVTRLDGRPVGTGRPGPVYRQLADLLRSDLPSLPTHPRTP